MHDKRVSIGQFDNVNRIGLGTNKICGPGVFGAPRDIVAARDAIRQAVHSGIGFIDTADSYGPEIAECIIGSTLAEMEATPLIATKIGKARGPDGSWHADLNPVSLRAKIEASLTRLQRSSIDLLQLHVFPDESMVDAVLNEVEKLREIGLVREVGLCNASVSQIRIAQGLCSIASVQNRLSAAVVDQELLAIVDFCEAAGIAFIGHQPFDSGRAFLTDMLRPFQRRLGRSSPSQLLLHALLQISPNIMLAPGTSDVSHLRSNVEALSLQLHADELRALVREIGNETLIARLLPDDRPGDLPARVGSPPVTTLEVPQQQLTQNAPISHRELLISYVSDLPGLSERRTDLAIPGSVAFHAPDARRFDGLMAGSEFLHFHPPHDGSMHLALSQDLFNRVIASGWGIRHLLAGYRVHERTVLLYAPRDERELQIITELIRSAYNYSVRGEAG